jgi:hypothetical protein
MLNSQLNFFLDHINHWSFQFLICEIIFCKTSMKLRETGWNWRSTHFPFPTHIMFCKQVTWIAGGHIVFGCAKRCSDRSRVVAPVIFLICFSLVSRADYSILSPYHRKASQANSFFVQGAILWNNLPSSVRREVSVGRFREEFLSSLGVRVMFRAIDLFLFLF